MKINFKTEYLFIILIIILIPVFVWLIAARFSSNTSNNTSTDKALTSSTPTPVYVVPTGLSKNKVLAVTHTLPIDDTGITYQPIQPIEFSFNNSVDAAGIKYSVNPKIDVVVKNGSYANKVLIYPAVKWNEGITTITILPGSSALDGTKLYIPFTYELNTAQPTVPPHSPGAY